MKKTLLILGMITLIFAGCKKFDEIEASKVEIMEEKIEKGWDYIKIDVEYDYPVDLEAVTLYLSEKEDMSGAEAYECNLEGKKFTVDVEGLKEGVAYYYCYEYDNGYEKEKSETCGLMVITTTKDITNVGLTKATCGGDIIYYGDDKITSRGVCWSTSQNPTINDNKTTEGSGIGSYSSYLSNLSDNTTYYIRAYATNEKGTSYGEQKSFTTLERTVDLGLSVKWATCNVGANRPEEYGDYFAWGETTTKTKYTEYNSLTYDEQMDDISGNPQYDAATANWGGDWRMPTKAELNELLNNCTWTWTAQNGVSGYNVEGPNGNSIFLPASGFRDGSSLYYAGSYGFYWSSTPYESNRTAYYLYFSSDVHGMSDYRRYYGRSVRPVLE